MRDGGDVGQRLGGGDVGLVHLCRLGVEQVEGADHVAAQSHRKGVHGVKPSSMRLGGEARPATVRRRQALVDDRLTGPVAVEARALLGLQLEQLEQVNRLAGRGHHPQVALERGQQQSGGSDVEHLDAPVGEPGQQLDDIEVGDQRVGQLHQRSRQRRFSRHHVPDTSCIVDNRRLSLAGALDLILRLLVVGLSEAQPPGDHVVGHVGERSVVAEGVRPQPDQRRPDADAELDRDHAGSLVDLVAEVGCRGELVGERPGRRVGLEEEDCAGGDVGHDESVGMLIIGQRSRPVAVQAERTEPDSADPQRKGEDRHGRLPRRRARRRLATAA